ncbi:dnd system-associated protein 4 [Oscillatoriales cyanobacterium USR001]|nr:dnd system-associated protein 4 [Oscillatoriales cyanobacterium USR001]
MGINRINVAKDKADLVKALTVIDGKTGPFQTYADAIAFAAAVGVNRQKRVPIKEVSKKEPGPISLEIFVSRGYDSMIKLIAIAETKDTNTLSLIDEASEDLRITIFEEYANGGLEILREELRGAGDYLDQLLLMLLNERFKEESSPQSFDLRRFL